MFIIWWGATTRTKRLASGHFDCLKLESQLVVEIDKPGGVDSRSRHRASFREFSLGGEAHTEVLTRWLSPEWICLRL
jgi:hypothetical protein